MTVRAALAALALLLPAAGQEAPLPIRAGPGAPLALDLQPSWSRVKPRRVVTHSPDRFAGDRERGAALAADVARLRPGDMLIVESATYAFDGMLTIAKRGSPAAPIWIAARWGGRVVLRRDDARQNVVNVDGARFLALHGLEITGGSQGVRLIDASEIWIDRCRVHGTGDAGITANSADTSALFLTRNEIFDTDGTGEGMYLGGNHASAVMSRSVIAHNHVHHTGGRQGDGIEVKQGSWGNRIVANHVHDTPYPCIILYGTGGMARNVVERNVCHDSGDNVMQVQGEAIVRNNLLVNGAIGFHSHDHQGKTKDLVVAHNTIVNRGPATDLYSWNGRPGMRFVNNAVYARDGAALAFPNGSDGVTLAGNVVLGEVEGVERGFARSAGLADFVGVTWDGASLDARPAPGGDLVGACARLEIAPDDITGAGREEATAAGCFGAPP